MKPFLMGSETEYAVSGRNGRGPISAEEVYVLLYDALRQERRWLPDMNGGRSIFLEQGGRYYLDAGAHPEYATPECFTPAQVACYDLAGERLLELARGRAGRDHPGIKITILKNNLGPLLPGTFTWGNHESYLCWVPLESAAAQLIPHLVSRLPYAGAGCFARNGEGMGFELSQRARHLYFVTGTETTHARAIFCTRVRKTSDASEDGWTRAHLIGKDSQRAGYAIALTFGVTGLLFLLVNDKRKVGKGLALADPVQALRAFSLDPWLKVRVPLADGRRFTALEIQEAYLAECEREVQKGSGFPPWVFDVLRHWRQTLEALAKDPLRLAGRLDAYTKLFIYEHELRRAGCSWGVLQQALKVVEKLRASYPDGVVRAVLAEEPHALPVAAQPAYGQAVAEAEASRPGRLDRLRFTVRLQALDLNYHELGGFYDPRTPSALDGDLAPYPDEVERATREAPPGGRAALRAEFIRSTRESGWACDWQYVLHGPTGTFVDLRNPFETERKTQQVEGQPEEGWLTFVQLQTRQRRAGR
jgi:proteasome accessory factor A